MGFSPKQTIRSLYQNRDKSIPLTWLTCYDYSFATIIEKTEVDMILVGDSGGMVALGYGDTVPVTMNEMIQFASAVRRGAPNKFVVGDMPKGSYESSNEIAVENAMRFCKEGGCDAIKLEGGIAMAGRVKAIADSGIPVIGHLGLTPQSASALGGYRVIGRSQDESDKLTSDIEILESSGAFAILLEAVPPTVAKNITSRSKSLIFGIGAGPWVNGQLLILHDMLGLYPNFRPKFAKCYVPQVIDNFRSELSNVGDLITFGRNSRADGIHEISRLAIDSYVSEVRSGIFPDKDFSYKDE
jgi:3-methyl-2-oxobutanoate hydroxymethyltransferase